MPKISNLKSKTTVFVLIVIALSSTTAYAGLTKTEVSQLYVAIFGRASEGEGNSYWQTAGLDMAVTANVMLETDAAKNYFGAGLHSNQAFIEHIYLNTLNKTPAEDAAGIAYWVGLLNQGLTRGQVSALLVGVIKDYAPGGPYYNPDDAATVRAYNQFTNRVTVSDYMADTVYNTPENWETVTKFDAGGLNVTDDGNTVSEMFAVIDGYATVFVYAGTWSGSYSGSDSGVVDFTVRSDGYVYGRAFSNYLQNYLNITGSVSNSGFLTAEAAGNNFSGQMTKEGTVNGIWSDTYVSGIFSAVQITRDTQGDSNTPYNAKKVLTQASNIGRPHYHYNNNIFSGFGTVAVSANQFSDCEIEAKIMSTDDDHIGLVFRYQDVNNYYAFIMDDPYNNEQTGTCLIKRVNGLVTFLTPRGWQGDYIKNKWYDIRISLNQSQIMVYQNSQLLFHIQDTSFPVGKIGMASDFNSSSFFDDISIHQNSTLIFFDSFENGMANWQIIDEIVTDEGPSQWSITSVY